MHNPQKKMKPKNKTKNIGTKKKLYSQIHINKKIVILEQDNLRLK